MNDTFESNDRKQTACYCSSSNCKKNDNPEQRSRATPTLALEKQSWATCRHDGRKVLEIVC